MAYVGVEVIVKPRRYVAVLLLMLLWRCVAGPEIYYVTTKKETEENGIKQMTAKTVKESDIKVRKTVKAQQKENGEALALGRTRNPGSLHGHRWPCRLPGKLLPYRIVHSSFT